MPKDSRLGGRVRTRTNAQVRARTPDPHCPLCGYRINRDLKRTGSPHPLSSVIDEWYPRANGGDPHDVDNCVELHRVCNAIKGKHWPVTQALATQCRERVNQLLGNVTINAW